jgi:hypothetical protein
MVCECGQVLHVKLTGRADVEARKPAGPDDLVTKVPVIIGILFPMIPSVFSGNAETGERGSNNLEVA